MYHGRVPRAQRRRKPCQFCQGLTDHRKELHFVIQRRIKLRVPHLWTMLFFLLFSPPLHPTHQIFKFNSNGFLSHKHIIVMFFCFVYSRHHFWFAAISFAFSSVRITFIEGDKEGKEKLFACQGDNNCKCLSWPFDERDLPR